ncbi:MAG: hypothetical protein PUP90_24725 [Nostoc sp. S4]|nr:hypothetical protein [Nostoc sp. S4]
MPKIIQDVLENDIYSVVRKEVVTTEEIERILKDASSELPNIKPSLLKRLGIDEIALIKAKRNNCAVLIHIDTSKLLAIFSRQTQEIIRETLISSWTKLIYL